MNTSNKKFLEFNGRNIFFVAKDGQYWVAIKPICEALGVDYIRQFKNLQTDEILSQLLSEQTMVAADNKLRKMVSLPEKFVYGWIFQIKSSSPDLNKYKLKVYEIVYDYFKGTITKRSHLLQERTNNEAEIKTIEDRLTSNEDYKRLVELQNTIPKLRKELKNADAELISGQMDIWDS
ncbi:MAG: hypothetical protein HQ521_13500 [Bacteroidetes bacterium]|nr:hypothetical protein [Bacteroidota bacterium]